MTGEPPARHQATGSPDLRAREETTCRVGARLPVMICRSACRARGLGLSQSAGGRPCQQTGRPGHCPNLVARKGQAGRAKLDGAIFDVSRETSWGQGRRAAT